MWSFLVFVFAVFSALFIPGDTLLKRLRLATFERLVLGTIVGIVLLAFQGMIFGYLHMRWATYLYLIIFGGYWIWSNLKSLSKFKLKVDLKALDFVVLLTMALGVLIQLSAVWNIGEPTSTGILFCCRNVPDTIYHLALTNNLTKSFPPLEPGMATAVVQNYHYWSNLVSAELIRVYNLPLAPTVYQYLALLISVLVGCAGLVIGRVYGLSKSFSRWLVFFLYFFGDILFVFTALLGRGINMNFSMLDDASQLLTGPPRAFSIVILLGGISLLGYWLKKRDFMTGFITILTFTSLVGFKVYAGIFALAGLGILGVFFLLKKQYKMVLPLLLAIIISAAIYLPVNQQAGGLIFVGSWRFENFIVNPAFGLSKLELARLVYMDHGNWLRVALLELFFAGSYFIFLFGTNLVAVFQTKKSLASFPKEIIMFLIGGLGISLVVGLFFFQTTGGANTIQFILNDYFILAIFSAAAVSYWLPRFKKFGVIIASVIILLTAPRVIHEGFTNFQDIVSGDGYHIDQRQVDVLATIRTTGNPSDKIVLDPQLIENSNYLYITFLSQRPFYLAGAGVLTDHGAISNKIIKSNAKIFDSITSNEAKEIIKTNTIRYLVCPASGCSGLVSGKTIYNGPSIKIIEI